MYKYQDPKLRKPLEEIRSDIKNDYEKIFLSYQLPDEMQFEAIIKAVSKGMKPRKNYPFSKLQEKFMDILSEKKLPENEFIDAVQIFVAIWNYFPHSDLGMSPIEKIDEERKKDPKIIPLSDNPEEAEYEMMLSVTDEVLQKLSKITEKIFSEHIKIIGGNKKDYEEMISIISDPSQNPDEALLLLYKMLEKDNIKKMGIDAGDIQPAVRAMCLYEWHATSKIENKHYNSRMFVSIIEQGVSQTSQAKSVNPIAVIVILHDTHLAIEKQAQKMGARIELAEAAHHCFDWLVATDITEIIKYKSRGNAMLAIAVAYLISKTCDPSFALGCGDKKIKDLCTSSGIDKKSYDEEILRVAKKIILSCKDPFLMVANVRGLSPHVFDERITKIAPEYKNLSPMYKDDDLSIPSPFIDFLK